MKHQRQAWQQPTSTIDPQRLVFLDESGAKTNLTRLYGRAPRGERVIDATPHGHWCTTTMLGAIRLGGVVREACLRDDGPTNGQLFLTYVEQRLAPSLQPRDIVVMDNLSSHRVQGVRAAIEAVGAELWRLPPYSPDLNPIEKMWSMVKATLRSIAARTADQLHDAIGHALRAITPDDLQGFDRSCQYLTPT